ncbi:hypothetical protein KFL_003810070 [Klebsormidium nitens]|uniref:Uncharacterized protein n=1 Tax=Klebsormidium nitens TaxID=105231 RepID=A0A1Y1IBA8_KLENI|nr:hypothetical protein KFL_003810070 [Klebsormidium nitens]|eukprot:GAQ87843.1 hypothetical protein KFL_003810070 [Klebsormidium nitens]
MSSADDDNPRMIRRSQRERKENRAWTPTKQVQRHDVPTVDPDAETCEGSEGDSHTPIRNVNARPRRDYVPSPGLSVSTGTPKSKEEESDEASGSAYDGLEDEGEDGVLGEAASAADKEYQSLKAELDAQLEKAAKKRDAAQARVLKSSQAPSKKKTSGHGASQRPSDAEHPPKRSERRQDTRPKEVDQEAARTSALDRRKGSGVDSGPAASEGGRHKERPKMKPLFTPVKEKGKPTDKGRDNSKRQRSDTRSARELELEEQVRKQQRQMVDLTNKINSARPPLPPDMDNQWKGWYGAPPGFPPFWQGPPASALPSALSNAAQPNTTGGSSVPAELVTSPNLNFIVKIISDFYKSADSGATFYPENQAFIKTRMERELAQSPSDPQWQRLWAPGGAFQKAASTKIINQRSNYVTKMKEGIVQFYKPPHHAAREFFDFAEREAAGATYRKEPEPGFDPFGRKEFLETLGHTFVTNWKDLPPERRTEELKLNVQQVALAEAVFAVCFGYDGNVGNMKELPKNGVMAILYKKAIASVNDLNEEYLKAAVDVLRHPLLREPASRVPPPVPSRLKALPPSGSLPGGPPVATAPSLQPSGTAGHVPPSFPLAPPPVHRGWNGSQGTDGLPPVFEDSPDDWRMSPPGRGDPFGPPGSYWGKPRSLLERNFMIAQGHLVPDSEAQE